jgi:hypothetical protein
MLLGLDGVRSPSLLADPASASPAAPDRAGSGRS